MKVIVNYIIVFLVPISSLLSFDILSKEREVEMIDIVKECEVLKENADNLDPNYTFLQFWNGSSYQVVNNASSAVYLAPGQAFMVDPKEDSETINFVFPENLQTPQISENATLYKGTSIPEVLIHLTNGAVSKKTTLKYFNNTTTGLDVGYDAGTYNDGDPNFAIDTHLVSDSKGIDFMLQCLPNYNYENYIVPLSIKASPNEELIFSTTALNLPIGIKVYIEDKLNSKITDITKSNIEIFHLWIF